MSVHKTIMSGGDTLDYQISGEGDTTLLFVHGSYIDQTYWVNQVRQFSKNYTVVTFDLPGHGLSGKSRTQWSLAGFSNDLEILISELKLKNVILVGHSYGAEVCLMTTVNHPEPIAGFIAVEMFKNAGVAPTPAFRKQADTILQQINTDFEKTNEAYANMALLTEKTPGEIRQRVLHDYHNAWQPMGKATMPEVFELYKTEQDYLPRLKKKLYLINVDYMPTNEEPLRRLTGAGYDLIKIAGTSHFPMIESPSTLNDAIQQCITEMGYDK